MTKNDKCGIMYALFNKVVVIIMAIHLERDFIASKVVASSSIFDKIPNQIDYGKMFSKTNEDLVRPFEDIDFFDKDVLSVLSSGDHVLTARYLEANLVDSFDKNPLSFYYFYLRLWSIRYNNELYPNIMSDDYTWLEELLKKVEPANEAEMASLFFFKRHLETKTNLKNLFRDEEPVGKVIYRDASELVDYTNPKMKFYKADLFEDFPADNEYDILLISNILEWGQKNPKKLEKAAENIARVLKRDGIAVCSRLIFKAKADLEAEGKIFAPYFEQEIKGHSLVYHKK